MTKGRGPVGRGRGRGPQASRRGLLRAGLAIGTLALGERAAWAQAGDEHAHHMPELGVAELPVAPAIRFRVRSALRMCATCGRPPHHLAGAGDRRRARVRQVISDSIGSRAFDRESGLPQSSHDRTGPRWEMRPDDRLIRRLPDATWLSGNT